MLPTHANGGKRKAPDRGGGFLPTYLRRIVKPSQMDFEYTSWLMLQLCLSPKTAYRHTSYHKQTKNQWARDDPAFVVITSMMVAVAAVAYCITFSHSVSHSIRTVVSAVLVDFLLIGAIVATICQMIANKALKKKAHSHAVEQQVEWMYAFDIHCNSYLPLFLLLYVVQFVLSPLLLWRSFLSTLLSNALFAIALSYYHYLSFLGYSALPFLEHTEVFLWPVGMYAVLLPLAILFGFNPTRFALNIYFG
eukprot:jgi/Botrbrau1/16310/Bobra.0066s0078.1